MRIARSLSLGVDFETMDSSVFVAAVDASEASFLVEGTGSGWYWLPPSSAGLQSTYPWATIVAITVMLHWQEYSGVMAQ